MIITIARECGCKGDKIGMALAEKYGVPFYNKKAISQLAKEKGNYEKFPDFYGEIPVDTLLYSISLAEEDGRLYQTPQKALAPVIGKEDCIILGRCGNYVFRDRDDVVSVFLTGDIAWREENIAKKHDVSLKKAHNIVSETDHRRASYHKYYTGENWGMAGHYDLCLDVSKIGVEGALRVIGRYLEEIQMTRKTKV